ncbi:COX15/CtaA family protein [Kocuria coralli]|uniref:COX15/CtaA family protein n=1 Tax=Kocuria coralli TaxID=1461025 RepID=UPI001FECA22B|nr:COX15/CtaA family protein [Kocuria coralli]
MSYAPTDGPSTPAPQAPDAEQDSTGGSRNWRSSLGAFFFRTRADGWVLFTAWASLVANSLLILTGGLVRLTGSGLGCPTWPRCTDESWTSTAEMGLHGAIEFGNRLLTFVLAVVAVAAFLAVLRLRRRRPDFFALTLILGLGIPLQAVVGGITVHTGLNPWVVGIHFMISAVMIFLAATYVNRVRRAALPAVAEREAPGQAARSRALIRCSAVLMAVLAAVTVYLGTLVTGTGPHSGDAGEVVRHTFDAVSITRAHALPVYALVALVALSLIVGGGRWPRSVWRAYAVVGAVIVGQALIGFYQYFNGVPIVAVTLHLVGSAVMVATVAFAVEKAFAVTSAKNAPAEPPRGSATPAERTTDPAR